MKYLYILVSSRQDYYWEQLYISLTSLRRYHPDGEVVLLTDDRTEGTLTGFRGAVRPLIQQIIVKKMRKGLSAKARASILKASMRSLVRGEFLYIDLDTVIAGPLDGFDKKGADVMMAPDLHSRLSEYCYFNRLERSVTVMGYRMGYGNVHYNSGVIYARDTEAAGDLFALWKRLYRQTWRNGLEMDQLALNEANARLHGVIGELDQRWNVQMSCGLKYLHEARIIHYLGYTQPENRQKRYLNTLPFLLCEERIFAGLREKERITEEIAAILENPRAAFKTVTIVPSDCVAYPLLFSNHMRLLKFFYVSCRPLFDMLEGIYERLFWRLYGRG